MLSINLNNYILNTYYYWFIIVIKEGFYYLIPSIAYYIHLK